METLINGEDPQVIAKSAYEAYALYTGGKTYDGREMPTWFDLPHNIQSAWVASARAVADIVLENNLH